MISSKNMNSFSHVPPGFRFHPTDEELVDYYLRKKIASKEIDLDVIKEVDLYKIEPWDLLELCKISEEQSDWYFFSHKDKKYPTGTRTNRATKAGFWKATGRDKAIYSKLNLIGMRKTLVFYKGRAPNGQKSDWIMHEYRLETNENATPQEEGWVVCRAFRKKLPSIRNDGNQESLCWYEDQSSFMQDFESPRHIPQQQYPNSNYNINPHNYNYSCKEELDQLQYNIPHHHHHDPFLQLPHLENPKIQQIIPTDTNYNFLIPYNGYNKNNSNDCNMMLQSEIIGQDVYMQQQQQQLSNVSYDNNNQDDEGGEQVRDWRVMDKFVASQFSHGDSSSREDSNAASIQVDEPMNISSISEASSHMDLWK